MRRLRVLLMLLCAGVVARAQPSRSELVVTPAWLKDHLADPHLVILQVGMMDDTSRYAKEHIPGARYVDLEDVSVSSMNHTDSLMLEMPSASQLRARLAAVGISDDSRIIVYADDDDISHATRVLLTLDYAGLGTRSSFLDGGLAAWKKNGYAASNTAPRVLAGRLSALHVHPVVATIGEVQAHLKDPSFHLIDARAPAFYDGVSEGMKSGRKGHIPGAHNIPFTSVTDATGRLKPAEELTRIFAGAGVAPGDTVVAYCHIGQQATAVLFAARTLGHPVKLFDGSYQEWGRRTDLPVELK
jgi:thiosulfate/3-mercaptopyruvate sulfurtransferase